MTEESIALVVFVGVAISLGVADYVYASWVPSSPGRRTIMKYSMVILVIMFSAAIMIECVWVDRSENLGFAEDCPNEPLLIDHYDPFMILDIKPAREDFIFHVDEGDDIILDLDANDISQMTEKQLHNLWLLTFYSREVTMTAEQLRTIAHTLLPEHVH